MAAPGVDSMGRRSWPSTCPVCRAQGGRSQTHWCCPGQGRGAAGGTGEGAAAAVAGDMEPAAAAVGGSGDVAAEDTQGTRVKQF